MAGQFTFTNGPAAQGELPCNRRAISSLPVPLSPRIKTGILALAALDTVCRTVVMAGLAPKITSSGGKGLATGGAVKGSLAIVLSGSAACGPNFCTPCATRGNIGKLRDCKELQLRDWVRCQKLLILGMGNPLPTRENGFPCNRLEGGRRA